MDTSLLNDLGLIWAAAFLSAQICIRLKQPTIAGYMIAGVVIGPHILGLINKSEQISMLAEFGVAMMLFTLGVDLSLKQVLSSARASLLAGVLQISLTTLAAWAAISLFGLAKNPAEAFVFGCVCALSSTVVISKMLVEGGEADSIHGRLLISVALVQDLSLVIIIPFLPLLTTTLSSPDAIVIPLLKAALFMLVVYLGAMRIVPRLIAAIARQNSREMFLLSLVLMCSGVALASHSLGLSLALGAFLAGIMISESSYAHQALHDVIPLRDVFSPVFFVSIGMFLDPAFVMRHWIEVLAFVSLLVTFKFLIGSLAAMTACKNLRSAMLVGIGLAQVGEFSFVLITLAKELNLIGNFLHDLFFAGAVLSLIISPALITWAPRILQKLVVSSQENAAQATVETMAASQADHVVICGFGRIGKNLGMVLESHRIPFLAIELNAALLDDLRERNVPHIYGDALSPLVMKRANLASAAALVVTVPDPLSSLGIITYARERYPELKILARAHRSEDIPLFRTAGATAVVQPEFEASVEITRMALRCLNLSSKEIQTALDRINRQRYTLFREAEEDEVDLPMRYDIDYGVTGTWFKVTNSKHQGLSLKDMDIRSRTGITVLAIKNGETINPYPDPTAELRIGEEVYVVGTNDQIQKFEETFEFARFCPIAEYTSDALSQNASSRAGS